MAGGRYSKVSEWPDLHRINIANSALLSTVT